MKNNILTKTLYSLRKLLKREVDISFLWFFWDIPICTLIFLKKQEQQENANLEIASTIVDISVVQLHSCCFKIITHPPQWGIWEEAVYFWTFLLVPNRCPAFQIVSLKEN